MGYLLLGQLLWVLLRLAREPLEAHPGPRRRPVGRGDETEAALSLGAEHHPLRLDAAKLLAAQIAKHNHARAAHLINQSHL